MNKLIYRKLSTDILSFFLLSSIAITLIVWVIQGVNLLEIVSEQGHAIKVYFFYSLTNIPKILSKLIIFTYFLTLFVILNKYEENNEILVFWTNGIKKISFINFLAKVSILYSFFYLILNFIIVPYTQNLGQNYLKNSSIEFFPNLIQEKKFSNVVRNLTIFVEKYDGYGEFEGIYIKEKLDNKENKIIVASKGKLIKSKEGYTFKLLNGKITNIDEKGSFNLGFKETIYDIYKLNSKTRKEQEVDEVESHILVKCIIKFLDKRKNKYYKCEDQNAFFIKDIYTELIKRSVSPLYIIILSLISSLVILKPKLNIFQSYFKYLLFFVGFFIILISELSHKFIFFSNKFEILFLFFPILLIFLFYFLILIKSNFKFKYL